MSGRDPRRREPVEAQLIVGLDLLATFSALYLGSFAGSYVQGLLHSSGSLANTAITIGCAIAAALLNMLLRLLSAGLVRYTFSALLDLLFVQLWFFLDLVLIVGAVVATILNVTHHVPTAVFVAVGALAISLGLKLLAALPGAILGQLLRLIIDATGKRRRRKQEEE